MRRSLRACVRGVGRCWCGLRPLTPTLTLTLILALALTLPLTLTLTRWRAEQRLLEEEERVGTGAGSSEVAVEEGGAVAGVEVEAGAGVLSVQLGLPAGGDDDKVEHLGLAEVEVKAGEAEVLGVPEGGDKVEQHPSGRRRPRPLWSPRVQRVQMVRHGGA